MGTITGKVTGELDVSEHRIDGVGPPGPSDTSLWPHGAGRPIAADDEVEQGLGEAATRPKDRRRALGSSCTPASSVWRSTSIPPVGESLREHSLNIHLPDQRQVRERRVGQREIGQLDPDNPAAQVQVRGGRDVRPGQQFLRDPERAQHLQRAGMQDQRARRAKHLLAPLDDPHGGAVIVGLQGQRQAGRAGTGHQNLGRPRHEAAAVFHHAAPSAPAPAIACGLARNSSRRSPGSTI